jgi:hypothetical protein
MPKTTITIVILHHGEVGELTTRLREAKEADQILVLEDPSKYTPQVDAVVKKQQGEVIVHSLNHDFAAHRNSVFPKVTSDWTLFLDSDESLSPELWSEISTVIADTKHDSFFIPRRDIFLGKLLEHGETGSMKLVRLARTKAGAGKWERAIHEHWNVAGSRGILISPLLHTPHRSVSAFLQKLHSYGALEPGARNPLLRRKVLFELFFYPPAKFFKAIFWQQGWRDGWYGWVHAFLMAYYSLIVRVYCWEAWHAKS